MILIIQLLYHTRSYYDSLRLFPGILVIGSWNPTDGRKSVEFWSPAGSGDRCKLGPTQEPTLEPTPEPTTTTETSTVEPPTPDESCVYELEASCKLSDYPREMNSPTANLVSGQLVACFGESCEVHQDGEWNHLVNTSSYRSGHSSAANDTHILLIGGEKSNTTEWIPVPVPGMDPRPAQPGPFEVTHGMLHCTIQLSADVIVLTGGHGTEELVTEYHLTGDVNGTSLTPMGQPRRVHACGVYQDADGQQVL